MANQQHSSRTRLSIAIDRKLKARLAKQLQARLDKGELIDMSMLVSEILDKKLREDSK